jgi:hypothetical protein
LSPRKSATLIEYPDGFTQRMLMTKKISCKKTAKVERRAYFSWVNSDKTVNQDSRQKKISFDNNWRLISPYMSRIYTCKNVHKTFINLEPNSERIMLSMITNKICFNRAISSKIWKLTCLRNNN